MRASILELDKSQLERLLKNGTVEALTQLIQQFEAIYGPMPDAIKRFNSRLIMTSWLLGAERVAGWLQATKEEVPSTIPLHEFGAKLDDAAKEILMAMNVVTVQETDGKTKAPKPENYSSN